MFVCLQYSITRWLWQVQVQRYQIISWIQLISKHCFEALLRFEHRIEAVIHMRCNIIWQTFYPSSFSSIETFWMNFRALSKCIKLLLPFPIPQPHTSLPHKTIYLINLIKYYPVWYNLQMLVFWWGHKRKKDDNNLIFIAQLTMNINVKNNKILSCSFTQANFVPQDYKYEEHKAKFP